MVAISFDIKVTPQFFSKRSLLAVRLWSHPVRVSSPEGPECFWTTQPLTPAWEKSRHWLGIQGKPRWALMGKWNGTIITTTDPPPPLHHSAGVREYSLQHRKLAQADKCVLSQGTVWCSSHQNPVPKMQRIADCSQDFFPQSCFSS